MQEMPKQLNSPTSSPSEPNPRLILRLLGYKMAPFTGSSCPLWSLSLTPSPQNEVRLALGAQRPGKTGERKCNISPDSLRTLIAT